MSNLPRPRRRSLLQAGKPFFLIVLLALPAVWLLLRDQMFCTHDGQLHFYRLVALRHAIEQGLWFSRWTPGLVYGYGFPFFNFREIASYYVPEALFLLGLNIPLALNLVYAASLILSGWGTYLLARDIWRNELGGILAAAAYMYLPYQMLNIYARGNLPESMALGLLPLILWLFRKLVNAPRAGTFAIAALSLAALLLTHNISSLLFMPLLASYLIFLVLFRHHQGHLSASRHGLIALTALILGTGLTTFAWLPAILEKGDVQLYLAHSTRNNDFHYNFLTLAELLAPPHTADSSLLNPPMLVNLGLPQLILGAIGLLGLFRFQDSERRWHSGLLALATLVLLTLTLSASKPVWEALPLIRFVQFPWRLVGRAALPLALLAGAIPALIGRRLIASYLAVVIATTVLILAVFPQIALSLCSYPSSPTIADVMDFERATGLTGVDPLGTYLPRWVVQRPTGSPMETAIRNNKTPRRFDSTVLPAGVTLLKEAYRANQATIELDTPAAFQAIYHSFYFPGWTVKIDGEKVPIVPTDQTGLISFAVPAGRHVLNIRWWLTPLRAGTAVISLGAALGLLLGTWAQRLPGIRDPFRGGIPITRASRLGYLALLSIILLIVKLTLVDPGHTPLRRAQLVGSILPNLEHPLRSSFADGLDLLGFRDLPVGTAGSEFRIDLAWTAQEKPLGDYITRICLVNTEDLAWSAKETFRPRGYQEHPPTYQWEPGNWVWDSHSIPILPGTPPGIYQIKLTVFERDSLTPVNALHPSGQVAGPHIIIGEMLIERPGSPISNLDMQYTLNQQWGDLTLMGANLDRREAAPGDPALVTLFWRAEAPLPLLEAHLELLGPAESPVKAWQLPLVNTSYPPNMWRLGDAVMGQHLVSIPGRAADGLHSWRLTVQDQAGVAMGMPITLGHVFISTPERVWEPPAASHDLDARFTPNSGPALARLIGYELHRVEGHLKLDLIWQALSETETSYRVFVHLLAPDGSILAQSDGIPANWTRPTSGWAPGEFITDSHHLSIPVDRPAGEYRLVAGLYDFASGYRLEASQDTLATLTIP